MSTLVNIGEFARLSRLSVKALRHYHDIGLLVPVEISAISTPQGSSTGDVIAVSSIQAIGQAESSPLSTDPYASPCDR